MRYLWIHKHGDVYHCTVERRHTEAYDDVCIWIHKYSDVYHCKEETQRPIMGYIWIQKHSDVYHCREERHRDL